jgi:hypothetical protein
MTRKLSGPEIADLKGLLRGPETNLVGRICAQIALGDTSPDSAHDDRDYVLRVAERAAWLTGNVLNAIQAKDYEWDTREPTPEEVDEAIPAARAVYTSSVGEQQHG